MTTTSKISRPHPFNPSLLVSTYSPLDIHERLRSRRCDGCELGKQPDFIAPVVFRGNPQSGRMAVGEAPGLREDQGGRPFIGPAGELLDKIMLSVGWDSNVDWFITNVVLCRPVGAPGSGKQNRTPLASHRKACRPYIIQQINYTKPHLILLLGASAVHALLPQDCHQGKKMEELAGTILHSDISPDSVFFVMYHPAAIIHAKRHSQEEHQRLRQLTWSHIQLLKQIDKELKHV